MSTGSAKRRPKFLVPFKADCSQTSAASSSQLSDIWHVATPGDQRRTYNDMLSDLSQQQRTAPMSAVVNAQNTKGISPHLITDGGRPDEPETQLKQRMKRSLKKQPICRVKIPKTNTVKRDASVSRNTRCVPTNADQPGGANVMVKLAVNDRRDGSVDKRVKDVPAANRSIIVREDSPDQCDVYRFNLSPVTLQRREAQLRNIHKKAKIIRRLVQLIENMRDEMQIIRMRYQEINTTQAPHKDLAKKRMKNLRRAEL